MGMNPVVFSALTAMALVSVASAQSTFRKRIDSIESIRTALSCSHVMRYVDKKNPGEMILFDDRPGVKDEYRIYMQFVTGANYVIFSRILPKTYQSRCARVIVGFYEDTDDIDIAYYAGCDGNMGPRLSDKLGFDYKNNKHFGLEHKANFEIELDVTLTEIERIMKLCPSERR